MSRRLLYAAIVVALATASFIAFALPASAAQRTIKVRLATGQVIVVTVEAPPCLPMNQIPNLGGTPIEDLTPPGVCNSNTQTGSSPPPPASTSTGQSSTPSNTTPSGGGKPHSTKRPSSRGGHKQHHSRSHKHAPAAGANPQAQPQGGNKHKGKHSGSSGSAPSTGPGAKPSFFTALPGPTTVSGVPNFVIDRFRVPIFLLPIYQAAGIQYGVRWEVLAGINEIETDYGRNLSVSSAGAVGWMQFLPSTWKTWGVDANRDRKRDPYNPVDAIFSAARYLKAAGGQTNIRKAIFAYNHASWYVDSVMLRARVLAGYPADFVGSLTGMTEARFPVAARARYQDAATAPGKKKLKAGQNAADVVSGTANRRSIDIFSRQGAPVVAVNDGVVQRMGHSQSKGNFIVLQDVYGNNYTYSQLGSIQQAYPVPKPVKSTPASVQSITAHGGPADHAPTTAATAGRQNPAPTKPVPTPTRQRTVARPATRPAVAAPPVAFKARLFAHPTRPGARSAGGLEQVFEGQTAGSGYTTFDNFFAGSVIGLNAHNARLKPLKPGSSVIGGTILGRIGGATGSQAPHVHFEVQPAGKGAPKIDPKPILDGWKLLASTNIYGASGKDALYGNTSSFTIGEVLLLPKPLLEQRVLSDPRIKIYACGRNDIRTGQIDRRVLATLEYLADSGLDPTVTALKCGHSYLTTSGNVSEHVTGDAVDIGAINGTSILGHQGPGSIAETTVRRLMQLQGTMTPHQIISLMDFGANTMALPDHYNHIHVGFHPLFGPNAKLGQQTASILKPGQWDALVQHLGQISNPVVPTKPSKFALPVKGTVPGE